MTTWKITRSFILPVIVLILVPWCIHTWIEPLSFTHLVTALSGLVFLLIGLGILAWTNVLFIVFGEGTLAPWDKTKKLVILGPYRYVRNPMILGVITSLFGEALLFGSFYLLAWALLFSVVNHLYLSIREEQELTERFGEAYTRYKASVPRWLPSVTPVNFDP
ncbi:MAG: isoprenylcysteine carboxylmethyltransferase family protein [Cryomorphaceae bacterium]